MPPSRDDLADLTLEPERYLLNEDPILRRIAVTSLDRSAAARNAVVIARLATDTNDAVRTAAAERLGWCGSSATEALDRMRGDLVPAVREAVATAYGELGHAGAIQWLVEAANSDEDRQVREASVAALGAIGSDDAIEPLLDLISGGPPQVRRRAIAAITVFDDARIEPAIRRAALDRNPGVREAAEMVVGRQIVEAG